MRPRQEYLAARITLTGNPCYADTPAGRAWQPSADVNQRSSFLYT